MNLGQSTFRLGTANLRSSTLILAGTIPVQGGAPAPGAVVRALADHFRTLVQN